MMFVMSLQCSGLSYITQTTLYKTDDLPGPPGSLVAAVKPDDHIADLHVCDARRRPNADCICAVISMPKCRGECFSTQMQHKTDLLDVSLQGGSAD